MQHWGDDEVWYEKEVPERPPGWTLLDYAIVIGCFVLLVVVGVWQS